MTRLTLLTLAAIPFAFAQDPFEDKQDRAVVLDASTLRPLAGVTVIHKRHREVAPQTTAADGSFAFWNLSTAILLSKPGYVQPPHDGYRYFNGEHTPTGRIYRMFRIVDVAGHVVDEDGKPIAHAVLHFRNRKPVNWGNLRREEDNAYQGGVFVSNAAGHFEAKLAPLDYQLDIVDRRDKLESATTADARRTRRLAVRKRLDLRPAADLRDLRLVVAPTPVSSLHVTYDVDPNLPRGEMDLRLTPADQPEYPSRSFFPYDLERNLWDRRKPWSVSFTVENIPDGDYQLMVRWRQGGNCDICPISGVIVFHRNLEVRSADQTAAFTFRKPSEPLRLRVKWLDPDPPPPPGHGTIAIGGAATGLGITDAAGKAIDSIIAGDNLKVESGIGEIRQVRWNGAIAANNQLRITGEEKDPLLEVDLGVRAWERQRQPPKLSFLRLAPDGQTWHVVTPVVEERPLWLISTDESLPWDRRLKQPTDPCHCRAFDFEPPLLPTEDAEEIVAKYWVQGTDLHLEPGKLLRVQIPVIDRRKIPLQPFVP